MRDMTVSVINRDNQWDRLFEPLAQHMDVCDDSGDLVGRRKDVLSVLNFITYDAPTVHDAFLLFWKRTGPGTPRSVKARRRL